MALLMEKVEASFVRAVPWFASFELGAALSIRHSAAASARGRDQGRDSWHLLDQGRGTGLR